MLRENLWNKSVDECFADAPQEVRASVVEVQFRRREHPPMHMRDFYADLGSIPPEHAQLIVGYMVGLGMDADVPKYAQLKRNGYFDALPQ